MYIIYIYIYHLYHVCIVQLSNWARHPLTNIVNNPKPILEPKTSIYDPPPKTIKRSKEGDIRCNEYIFSGAIVLIPKVRS